MNDSVEKKSKKKQLKQPSRAKFLCPPFLDDFINVKLRQIPATAELLSIHPNLKEALTYSRENNLPKSVLFEALLHMLLSRCHKDFSKDFVNDLRRGALSQISNPPTEESYTFGIAGLIASLELYETFREQRIQLQTIARFFAQRRSGHYYFVSPGHIITTEGEDITLPILTIPLTAKNETYGDIDSKFANALIGINLDRIRECQICSNIFWANRTDSFTCSATCANHLRVQKYRNRNIEEIRRKDVARKANIEYKQKIKNNQE